MKSIGAAKAKAHLLSLLDEVEAKREPLLLTKNGRPVAQVMPMPLSGEDSIFGFLQDQIEIVGDIVSPLFTDEEYDRFFRESVAQLHDPA